MLAVWPRDLEASMQNSTRKMVLAVVTASLIVIALWMFGLLPVAPGSVVH
jgi:hypothetical protein